MAETAMRCFLIPVLLFITSTVQAQTPPPSSAAFRAKQLPHEAGFRVFIVPDMEGMGSAVDIREVIAGNEGERYKSSPAPTTGTASAACSPRRSTRPSAAPALAGARSFVVNEGHGGNLFANVLPWELDSTAILVRGFPKPLVMITGHRQHLRHADVHRRPRERREPRRAWRTISPSTRSR